MQNRAFSLRSGNEATHALRDDCHALASISGRQRRTSRTAIARTRNDRDRDIHARPRACSLTGDSRRLRQRPVAGRASDPSRAAAMLNKNELIFISYSHSACESRMRNSTFVISSAFCLCRAHWLDRLRLPCIRQLMSLLDNPADFTGIICMYSGAADRSGPAMDSHAES